MNFNSDKQNYLHIVSDEQWEIILKKHFFVAESYLNWCGPCDAARDTLKQLCIEVPSLSVVCVDADAVSDFREWRNSSQPKFLVFVGGNLMRVVDGLDEPLLREAVLEHAPNESRVLEKDVSLHKWVKDSALLIKKNEMRPIPTNFHHIHVSFGWECHKVDLTSFACEVQVAIERGSHVTEIVVPEGESNDLSVYHAGDAAFDHTALAYQTVHLNLDKFGRAIEADTAKFYFVVSSEFETVKEGRNITLFIRATETRTEKEIVSFITRLKDGHGSYFACAITRSTDEEGAFEFHSGAERMSEGFAGAVLLDITSLPPAVSGDDVRGARDKL